MSKTLEEWIEIYNKKIPEGFERNEKFALFYFPEKGFAEFSVSGKTLVLYQVCGNFNFWRAVSEVLAKKLGCKGMGTVAVRNPKAFIRRAGAVIYKTEKLQSGERYFFKDKRTGQKGEACPAGEGTYFMTLEVNPE